MLLLLYVLLHSSLSTFGAASLLTRDSSAIKVVVALGTSSHISGCVNSIRWSDCGSFLISGSDDSRIMIWGGPEFGLRSVIQTTHQRNIFCALFVPSTLNQRVVSCSGSGSVCRFCGGPP